MACTSSIHATNAQGAAPATAILAATGSVPGSISIEIRSA
jgi:hypothetical protein